MIRRIARAITLTVGLLLAWQAIVWISGAEYYILPGPLLVFVAGYENAGLILEHAAITFAEILVALLAGTAIGCSCAFMMDTFAGPRRWLLPVLVVSQAIPVFALAPALTVWLGFGMAPKIAMAALIIFFPVTASLFDGLRRTEPGWLDLAATMTAGQANARWAVLRQIRLPAALPSLATGMRVATAVAPIGAIVGEWVGSSAGLGFLMLNANARTKVDLMFAALLTLSIFAVLLYYAVDWSLKRAISWQPEHGLPAVER